MTYTTRSRSEVGPAKITFGVSPAGHRLPASTRPGQVALQVTDLERSVDYYRGVLGLRLLDDDAGSASLAAQGDDRPLVVLRERAGALPRPPARRSRVRSRHWD